MYKLLASLSLIVVTVGCSGQAELLDAPSAFTGKLTSPDGKPVSNVLLTLQPLETGHPIMLEVDSNGTFQGTGVPGEYAYFVGASSKVRSPSPSLKRLPADALEASMDRKVKIGDSSELAVQLH